MLKRPFWAVTFAVAAGAAFLAAGRLLALLPVMDTPWGGMTAELALAALAVLGLLALGKGRVLMVRGRGFGEGMIAGGFLLGVSCLGLMGALAMWERPPMSVSDVLLLIAAMFAIGLAEELTFRALIQNVLADAFGRDSRRGVWRTVLVSGLIFGLVHLSNVLSGVSLPGAAMQTLAAFAIGMYLGAVYVRCGTIWPLVALHGLNDLVGMIAAEAMGDGGAVETISSYGPEKFITVGIYIALAAFLLRRKKLDGLLKTKSGPV